MKPVTFTSPTDGRIYRVVRRLADKPVCDRWLVIDEAHPKRKQYVVRMAANPGLNEYLENEARVLRHLNVGIAKQSRGLRLLIPDLVDSYVDGDRALVITDHDESYYTLEEIRDAYPDGVPAPHVAWIFNKILAAIMLAHATGVIHGAVLPYNMLIHSGDSNDDMKHTGILTDWTCAVIEATPNQRDWPKLAAWDEDYASFYPNEVKLRRPVTEATDLAMAAGCAIYLLGGDVVSGEVQQDVPWLPLLRACRHHNMDARLRDPAAFHIQLQKALEQAYGKPTFRELYLPPRS